MRALILGSGAEKGAYHCGAVKYLLGDLKINYDIFCGVSAGAINAAFLSQFKEGEEQKASREINKLWLSLTNDSIYKRHFPFGKLHALWKKSFFDSALFTN